MAAVADPIGPHSTVMPPELTPDLGEATIAALLGHAPFEAAMQNAAAAIIEHYHGNWVMNRLAGDRGRVVMGFMILDLHYTSADGKGFTAAQVQDLGMRISVCSRGRLMAFLAALRLMRLLRPVPDDDRRVRRLAPTEPFYALHRTRLTRLFGALALLFPEAAAAIPALDHTQFVGGFAHALGDAYRGGIRVMNFVPVLRPTAERDAGLVVLIALLLAEQTGDPVTISALARRFSISRAHVLAILREAQALDLAATSGARGSYRAGPNLAPAMRRMFAVMFLLQIYAIRAASASPAERDSMIGKTARSAWRRSL